MWGWGGGGASGGPAAAEEEEEEEEEAQLPSHQFAGRRESKKN